MQIMFDFLYKKKAKCTTDDRCVRLLISKLFIVTNRINLLFLSFFFWQIFTYSRKQIYEQEDSFYILFIIVIIL